MVQCGRFGENGTTFPNGKSRKWLLRLFSAPAWLWKEVSSTPQGCGMTSSLVASTSRKFLPNQVASLQVMKLGRNPLWSFVQSPSKFRQGGLHFLLMSLPIWETLEGFSLLTTGSTDLVCPNTKQKWIRMCLLSRIIGSLGSFHCKSPEKGIWHFCKLSGSQTKITSLTRVINKKKQDNKQHANNQGVTVLIF